ncbi:hypothetical protein CBR_g39341 [Chara braunii]|uniref:Uncharacterized protein n=1 Tax=Chara braunii TaxID=69332 RepID=A0A388LRJ6_CHABU|nr:hypothetical protein CBR_g39341 [Chara braunii]|eukprot:GBG84879.1 hypothetical protein CBR_g39341 [Chara braunii]
MMLCCTFCNKVFQGTLFQAMRHFVQTNYCKDVSDEVLYQIGKRTQQKFMSDQMERVSRYAAERGLDVPWADGATGGQAVQRPRERRGTGQSTRASTRRRACIFHSYPRDDDSNEERAPDGVDDPALPIPREIDETHEEADHAKVRTYATRRSACRAKREMMGGDEDFWGPFGEVAFTGDVRDDRGGASHADTSYTEARRLTPTPSRRESPIPSPPAPNPAPPTPVSPVQPASTQPETEELASSLPPHGLLQRLTVVRQLRLRSPSPGVLQEEGEVAAAEQEAPAVGTTEEEVSVQATAEEEVAAAQWRWRSR